LLRASQSHKHSPAVQEERLASTKSQFQEMRNSQKPKAVVATQDFAQLRTSPIPIAALPRLRERVPTAGSFNRRNTGLKSAINGANKVR